MEYTIVKTSIYLDLMYTERFRKKKMKYYNAYVFYFWNHV